MKAVFVLLFATLSFTVWAQKDIKLEEVKNHIGDSVKVEAIFTGVKVFVDDDNRPTLSLINLGGEYPNQLLTVAVYPSYKGQYKVMPEEGFKGDKAIVFGKIELYKGKPQIVVRSSNQLSIVSTEAIVVPKQ